MAQENLDLNINIETKGTEVIGLFRKELKEANGELLKAQTLYGDYSAEAVKAAQKVALLKDKIQEARETSDLFDPGKKFQALTGSLTAVAGGFGAIQGAMALFGVESDNVQKALLKVNAAMALSQGLSTIKDSAKDFERLGSMIKLTTFYQQANNAVNVIATTIMRALGISVNTTSVAFTRLKIAIAATGIGLLVAGIALAVTAFENFAGAAEKAEEAQKKLNKQIQDGAKVQLEGEIESLNRQEKLDIAKAKLRGATEEEIFKIEQGYRKDRIEAQQRYVNEIANIDAKAAADTQNAINNAANDAEVARLAEQKRIQDNKIQNAIETIEFQTQKEYEGEIKKYEILKELRDKLGRQEVIDYKELAKLRNEQKEADEKEIDDRVTNIMSNGLAARTQRQLEQFDKDAKLNKDVKDAQIKAEYELQDAKFAAVSAGLNLLSSLAGKSEAIANTLFVIDRALAIAQIIVNTQREIAAVSAANAPLGVAGIPITASQILAAKIRAGVGIATIAATSIAKFKNGGSNASNVGGGMPSVGSSAPMAPQLPQAQTTNLSQQTINDIGNQAVRAYVVESDVTSSQERITAIRQRARFS
jgi:hypothetical protein